MIARAAGNQLRPAPGGRRDASRRWPLLFVAMLVLAVAGVPRILHFSLVPHRWCPLHQRIEHVPPGHAHGKLSCDDRGKRCRDHSAADRSTEEPLSDPPEACHYRIVPVPVVGSPAVEQQTPILEPRVVSFVDSGWTGIPRDVLACAPKRSPPDAFA